MTRIVKGKIVSDEEDLAKYGPLKFLVSLIRSIIAFIQMFFQSIFNPQALSTYRRPGGSGGSGGGSRKSTIIHGIKPTENCPAGS
jgi:hypothetical protein